MPVITRSCQRLGGRRRLEDPTPQKLQTPAKKLKVRKSKETNKKNCESDGGDKNCQTNQMDENCQTNENDWNTTTPTNHTTNDSNSSLNASQSDGLEHLTPVAARTRSFSALKRSYRAKRAQKNKENATAAANITEKQTGNDAIDNENKIQGPVSETNREELLSTCVNEDVEMREEEVQKETDCTEEERDDFYKKKFHEVIQHLKTVQENFENAQAIINRNIAAYDAHIKGLTEELQTTKEQLVAVQKELEQTNQQNSDANIQTEPSKAELEMVNELESKIKFYEMLSGLQLSQEPDSSQSFIKSYSCLFKPAELKGKAMKFRLVYDKEIDEVEFNPSAQSPSSGEFLQKLPRCLKENIYFTTDQATSFLLRLIQAIHKHH